MTQAYGEKLATYLRIGDVLALSGPLGAGKTTLVRSIAEALGVASEFVASPSYTLVNVYHGKIPIYHVDLYRLDNIEAVMQLDLDEYLFGDGVCLIEWPEVAFAALPKNSMLLRIDFLNHPQNTRRARFWRQLPPTEVLRSFLSSQVSTG